MHCQFAADDAMPVEWVAVAVAAVCRVSSSSHIVSFNCHFDFYYSDAVSFQFALSYRPPRPCWAGPHLVLLLWCLLLLDCFLCCLCSIGVKRGVEKGAKGDGTASISILQRLVNIDKRAQQEEHHPTIRVENNQLNDERIVPAGSFNENKCLWEDF